MDVNSSKDMGGDDMLISAAISSVEVIEASPDSLKNTPSNIAKLEDVIEHCVGRQKYLTQTRSPSDGGDVRWYFCKVPLLGNELAAFVPKTEIVGKGDYFRFGMRDSLAIEAFFLQIGKSFVVSKLKDYPQFHSVAIAINQSGFKPMTLALVYVGTTLKDLSDVTHGWGEFSKTRWAKSKKFKDMKKKQLPHTCSRRGYARLADDLKNSSSSTPIT